MKRVAEDDNDALYEAVAAVVQSNAAQLAEAINDPIPPIPVKDLDRFYRDIGDDLVANAKQCKAKARFTPYEEKDKFRSKPATLHRGWPPLHEWAKAMDARAGPIWRFGTEEQLTAFWDRVSQLGHEPFRIEFAKGWNDRHPKLPGTWEENKRDDEIWDFVVRLSPPQ